MIYVRVELWPCGSKRNRKLLTEGYIANDGTGNAEVGNYAVQLMKEERYTPGTWKRGKVKGFARLTKGVWDLIYLALRDAVGDRNKLRYSPDGNVSITVCTGGGGGGGKDSDDNDKWLGGGGAGKDGEK